MASENETVADIVREMRNPTTQEWEKPDEAVLSLTDARTVVALYADRIESAWRSEKAQVMQSATEVAMAPTQVRYEPRPRRNCDRFASYNEAVNAWNRMSEYEREKLDQLFKEWLFAPVAEGGES
jgi:hypothetical protein